MKSLRTITNQLHQLSAAAEQDPLRFFSPTKAQLSFLTDQRSSLTLFRGANQCGKTTCGLVKLLHHLLGISEYIQVKKPPIIGWCVTHSWEQSKAIQQKLYELTPKHELHPDTVFQPGNGFRGTGAPVIVFNNGSILRIKTTGQTGAGRGTLALASESVDVIHVDEPCDKAVASELFGRIARTRGKLWITMTPTLPVDWLKKMVEEGRVSETVAPLNIENVTPIGCRPLLSVEELRTIEQNYLAYDRAVRMQGAWHTLPEARIFEHFTQDMVSDRPCRADGEYQFAVGIDHGSDANSEVIILGALDTKNDFLYILDEYVSDGDTAENHARGLLNMLRRNGLEYLQLFSIVGDRSHGGHKYGGRMSNRMIESAIAHQLGYRNKTLPIRIKTAYKPRFSVYYGCQQLNQYMLKGQFQIFPRCKRTIRRLENWELTKNGSLDLNSEWTHCLDAARYMLMPLIDKAYRLPRISRIRIK